MTAKITTWSRDTFELLDYDTTETLKHVLKTKSSTYLIRENSVPRFVQDPFKESPNNKKFLVMLQTYESKKYIDLFTICPLTAVPEAKLQREQYEKLWLVVKYLKNKEGITGYLLCEGDVIRVGRCKYRVKEIKTSSGAGPDNFNLCDMVSCNQDSYEEEQSSTARNYVLPCRICLSEQYEPENPLISPCNCGGTMKFIHLKCLQQCLMSKLTTKSSEFVLSFSWKKLGCDLCKKTYPYKLNLNGKTVELLEIPKPPGQYIILENLCKDKNSQKGLNVVHMANKNVIKLGRAQDCDLRISDISVSRNHAKLKYISGNFYLEDSGGKYGTLIQVKRPILLEDDRDVTLQSGRSLVTYSVKLPWSIIPACFKDRNSVFNRGISTRNMPILPLNTGIPISVSDPYKLLAFAGLAIAVNTEKYKQNHNLLHDYNHLGANSSFENDEEDIEEIEEVEIANIDEEEIQCEETKRFEKSDRSSVYN